MYCKVVHNVALVDASDQHHRRCVALLKTIREPLATVWPVLDEAMFLMSDLPRGQDAIADIVERGVVRILELGEDDVPRIRALLAEYRSRRVDLADAALIRVAEREGLDTIFTVNVKGFSAYRLGVRKRFRIAGGR